MTYGSVFSARQAYNLAASEYDRWPWQDVWRRIEAPKVIAKVKDGLPGPILDLGTGTGFYASVFARVGLSVIGLDISDDMILRARKVSENQVPFVVGDARRLPFREGVFSQVVAARVLSQIDDVEQVFSEVARVLRPGGDFIVSEIDPAHPYIRTELPSKSGKIQVETFKRARRDLIKTARRAGNFHVSSQNWIGTLDRGINQKQYKLSSLDQSQEKPLAFIFSLVR